MNQAKRMWGMVLLVAGLVVQLGGCGPVVSFPGRAVRIEAAGEGREMLTFDTAAPGKGDYQQLLDRDGRKIQLRYVDPIQQAVEVVRLDELGPDELPHLIIALDGVPFELVEQMYAQGSFRLFFRPSRLISTFPGMTDVVFTRIFGGTLPLAYEAEYFDRGANRLIDGSGVYLSGANADWARRLDYRCSLWLDAMAYIAPTTVFKTELRGMMSAFRRRNSGTGAAYIVGTAGLGTRGGRNAISKYLRRVDRLCEQIVYERRGRVKITLLADHGHNMVGWERVSFTERLREAGYRPSDRLNDPRDVVAVKYGLVTVAAFHTDDAGGVAKVLLSDPATRLACYREGATVVVETTTGRAAIREGNGNYSYSCEYGDPLELADIIQQLGRGGLVDENGFINDRALFEATARHVYPDPLRRIWLAFDGLVQHPADVIVCLRDGWYHGSKFYDVVIGSVASTHGSLNRVNSSTFVMSMWGELPTVLRPGELMEQLEQVRRRQQGR